MLDYLEVKKVFADKLANDADGIGRFESAFYHTMKHVYYHGVADGRNAEHHFTNDPNPVGIHDGKE